MSHQGYEGWFPECIVCHCGNVGPVICLEPACHEAHGLKAVVPVNTIIAGDPQPDERLIRQDGVIGGNAASSAIGECTPTQERSDRMLSASPASTNP